MPPAYLVVGLAFGLGLIVGSFLNVVIYRLPRDESVVSPGSHCPGCDRPIRPWDNIPLVSFAVLGGQCRHCESQIPWRYPAVELLAGLLFAAVALRYGLSWWLPLGMGFVAALLAAAAIDIDYQIIPDEISLGGLLVGLLLVPSVLWSEGATVVEGVEYAGLGALVGGGSLWLVGFVHARVSVLMGREFEHWPGEGEPLPKPGSLDYWVWFPGLGFGDVKLLAMVGVFLGPVNVLVTIVLASMVGLAMGVGWALATRSFASPFGFAPAIAGGALIAFLSPLSFLAR